MKLWSYIRSSTCTEYAANNLEFIGDLTEYHHQLLGNEVNAWNRVNGYGSSVDAEFVHVDGKVRRI